MHPREMFARLAANPHMVSLLRVEASLEARPLSGHTSPMPHATLDQLRIALDTADLTVLEGLLAEDVHWYGSRGGACHNRDDVLRTLRHRLAEGIQARLTDLRSVGDGIVLTAELHAPSTTASWTVALATDQSGRIVRMQDYENTAIAERDLTILAAPESSPAQPTGPVTNLVPFVFVADVARSIEFYQRLGMRLRRTFEPDGELNWAMLDNEQAAIMFARAGEPVDPRTQAVLFYLYSHDLPGLRDRLLAAGVWPGEVVDGTPGPRQEMRVTDPDGYCLMIAQIDDEPS